MSLKNLVSSASAHDPGNGSRHEQEKTQAGDFSIELGSARKRVSFAVRDSHPLATPLLRVYVAAQHEMVHARVVLHGDQVPQVVASRVSQE